MMGLVQNWLIDVPREFFVGHTESGSAGACPRPGFVQLPTNDLDSAIQTMSINCLDGMVQGGAEVWEEQGKGGSRIQINLDKLEK